MKNLYQNEKKFTKIFSKKTSTLISLLKTN